MSRRTIAVTVLGAFAIVAAAHLVFRFSRPIRRSPTFRSGSSCRCSRSDSFSSRPHRATGWSWARLWHWESHGWGTAHLHRRVAAAPAVERAADPPWVVGLYTFAVFAMVAVCASAAGILVVPVAIYASCVGEWFETAGFEVARRRDVAGSRWQDDLHRPDLVEVGDAVRGLPCAVDAVLLHAARGAQAQCRSM